VEAPEGALTEG